MTSSLTYSNSPFTYRTPTTTFFIKYKRHVESVSSGGFRSRVSSKTCDENSLTLVVIDELFMHVYNKFMI